MGKKFVVVSVEEDLHRRVKVGCAEQGVTISDVIREALQAFVDAGRENEK